ncbi:MAG: response regulator [Planctomycetia bacterium]|nr:response regulator [Planctomycetia bacterium]
MPPDLPVPYVLIVDDSEMVIDILSRMLTWLHVPFKTAASGREALELLEEGSFDIVMTDLLMPEMNGTELAQAIRAIPRYEKIKILAMSTENESIMYDKHLFDKVILKPIIRNALYDAIFGKTYNEE